MYNHSVALKLFDILSIGWVVFMLHASLRFDLRPSGLFSPLHWFANLLMPIAPSLTVVFFIGFLIILGLIYQIIRIRRWYLSTLIFIGLIWLNSYKYSYGFSAHINHLFLLVNFLAIPFPIAKADQAFKSIQLFHIGILFTYSSSGFFKVIVLCKKLFSENIEYNWFFDRALYYQAFISYRAFDEQMPTWLFQVLQIEILPAILMGLVMTIQTSAVFFALRPKVSFYYSLVLVVFHVCNMFLFKIYFWMSCFTLLLIFFPYHRLKEFSFFKSYLFPTTK